MITKSILMHCSDNATAKSRVNVSNLYNGREKVLGKEHPGTPAWRPGGSAAIPREVRGGGEDEPASTGRAKTLMYLEL